MENFMHLMTKSCVFERNAKLGSSTLGVTANVYIEIDQQLFNSFCSDHIQRVYLKRNTLDHTSEESSLYYSVY